MMKRLSIKLLSIFLIACIACGNLISVSAGVLSDDGGYEDYLTQAESLPYGKETVLSVKDIVSLSENSSVKDNINSSLVNGVVIPDDGYATWQFEAESDCLYALQVTYMPAQMSSGNIELELNIDNKIPFSEVAIVSFERTYQQSEVDFLTNAAGNHLKPQVTEIFVWKDKYVSDFSGYITEPFVFCFSEGVHTISFIGSRGSIAISKITLTKYEKPIKYSEYISEFEKKNLPKVDGKDIKIEGEYLKYKNSVTVLPDTDRSSANTTPQSAKALLLNTVGGDNWKGIGNAVTWEFEVQKDGLYEISVRFLQNTKDGIFTCRRLYIDGETPFLEAESLRFNYDSSWQCEKLGNSEGAYKFYLEAGKHTITFEATSGDVADIIKTVADSIEELNRINRRIKLITGNKIDTNRDYNFAAHIPEEIEKMAQTAKELQASVDNISEQVGANGSFVSVIQKIIFQLNKMSDNPRTIAKYFDTFQSNLGAMGEWLLTATEQPLEIDCMYIQPSGSTTPKANAGFFKSLWFAIENFIFSYVTDYSTIGSSNTDKTEKNLTVWVQTGRDQGQIIRELVDSDFAEKSDASVTLQVVSSGLLQSVLAGIAPDVVCDCAETLPMEYALRNAVADLTKFSDYEQTFERFNAAAVKPASFNGAVYGMPQTFTYLMMFYRTDIFEEYGYVPPTTWTQLCEMIPSLQRNGMEVGIPHTLDVFSTFLYQNNGELYKKNGAKTNLYDYTSIISFSQFTEFFTLYDCAVTYNVANRFRSGEMPLAIAPYTEYNQLTAFAPEIKGCWKMVPIPGTTDINGKINNVSVGTGTYLVMMNNSKNKETAWEFMKWFMSADVQSSYAVQMESVLGNCAKVASANVEALGNMTWSSSEYKELFSQLENVDSVPQVPGGYYLSRIVSFAFNRVYNNDENPKEVLSDYIKELDEELARKRAEFGLEEISDED